MVGIGERRAAEHGNRARSGERVDTDVHVVAEWEAREEAELRGRERLAAAGDDRFTAVHGARRVAEGNGRRDAPRAEVPFRFERPAGGREREIVEADERPFVAVRRQRVVALRGRVNQWKLDQTGAVQHAGVGIAIGEIAEEQRGRAPLAAERFVHERFDAPDLERAERRTRRDGLARRPVGRRRRVPDLLAQRDDRRPVLGRAVEAVAAIAELVAELVQLGQHRMARSALHPVTLGEDRDRLRCARRADEPKHRARGRHHERGTPI